MIINLCELFDCNPKNKQNGKGHDTSCPLEKLGNSMARAQFIVPLQHNYNKKAIVYCKIIRNTAHKIFYKKIFQKSFLGV